jgi:hypothetical protein
MHIGLCGDKDLYLIKLSRHIEQGIVYGIGGCYQKLPRQGEGKKQEEEEWNFHVFYFITILSEPQVKNSERPKI